MRQLAKTTCFYLCLLPCSYSGPRLYSQWGSCPECPEYIVSVENRPNDSTNYHLNFDFKQFQKVGAITQIISKTNSSNNGTFIHELLLRSNFRQKIKEIDDD